MTETRTGLLRRAAPTAIAAACFGLLAWWVVSTVERPPPAPTAAPPAARLADLIAEIDAGRPAAVEQALNAASRDWPAAAPALAAMLAHDNWRVRAAACRILATHLDESWLPALVARASDSDWRVRAAALDSLPRPAQGGDPPPALRDTPLEDRERWLLAWLDTHDRRAAAALAPELCELYADAAHLEFGRPLVDRCLACHVGTGTAAAEPQACRKCHPEAHEEWAASAHAQSLTHLHLVTVNPATRQPQPWDFGETRGIACSQCHRATGRAAQGPGAGDSRGSACPFSFDQSQPARDSCARCHAATTSEWQAWRAGRQPRRAVWPPAQIDLAATGDARDCTDCHMPKRGEDQPAGPRQHTWSARRNLDLLRGGIDVRVSQGGAPASLPDLRVTLTNLAGHAYPTGTRRRAVRLYAGPAGAAVFAAAMAPVRPGSAGTQAGPALAPGEQRRIAVPLPAGAREAEFRLLYFRDAANPQAYTAEIFSGSRPLDDWAAP
jgi:hypothetical protein